MALPGPAPVVTEEPVGPHQPVVAHQGRQQRGVFDQRAVQPDLVVLRQRHPGHRDQPGHGLGPGVDRVKLPVRLDQAGPGAVDGYTQALRQARVGRRQEAVFRPQGQTQVGQERRDVGPGAAHLRGLAVHRDRDRQARLRQRGHAERGQAQHRDECEDPDQMDEKRAAAHEAILPDGRELDKREEIMLRPESRPRRAAGIGRRPFGGSLDSAVAGSYQA